MSMWHLISAPDSHPLWLPMSVLTLYAVMQLLMPFIPVHAFAFAYTQYFPLLLLVPFIPVCAIFPPPFCTFTPICGPISLLYHLCQYLDQLAHYHKYHDQFLFILFELSQQGFFSEMVKTRGNFGWVSTPYIDLSHKMSPVVKVTSKALGIVQEYLIIVSDCD